VDVKKDEERGGGNKGVSKLAEGCIRRRLINTSRDTEKKEKVLGSAAIESLQGRPQSPRLKNGSSFARENYERV